MGVVEPVGEDSLESVLINEVQLLLAEKRTALSVLRTGIAVLALPLSVVSVLIATSRYYETVKVLHLLLPLLIVCVVLVLLGAYLIARSLVRLRHFARAISELKRQHSRIAEFID